MNKKLFNRKWNAKGKVLLFTKSKKLSDEHRIYEPVGKGYKLTVKGTNVDGSEYE